MPRKKRKRIPKPVVLVDCRCGARPELRKSVVEDFAVLCRHCGRHTAWGTSEKAAATDWNCGVLLTTQMFIGQLPLPEDKP